MEYEFVFIMPFRAVYCYVLMYAAVFKFNSAFPAALNSLIVSEIKVSE